MSIEGETALAMAIERRRDLEFVKGLVGKEELTEAEQEELRHCQVRQLMRRDAGYR